MQALEKHRETFLRDADGLAAYLLERDAVAQSVTQLSSWASLQRSADSRNADWRALSSRGWMLWSELGRATSWFRPVILAADRPFVDAALATRVDWPQTRVSWSAPWPRPRTLSARRQSR